MQYIQNLHINQSRPGTNATQISAKETAFLQSQQVGSNESMNASEYVLKSRNIDKALNIKEMDLQNQESRTKLPLLDAPLLRDTTPQGLRKTNPLQNKSVH